MTPKQALNFNPCYSISNSPITVDLLEHLDLWYKLQLVKKVL